MTTHEFSVSAIIDDEVAAKLGNADPEPNPFVTIHIEVKKPEESVSFVPIGDFVTYFFSSLLRSIDDILAGETSRVASHDSPDYLEFIPEDDTVTVVRSDTRNGGDHNENSPHLERITVDKETVVRGIISSAEEYLSEASRVNPALLRDTKYERLRTMLENQMRHVETHFS